MTSSEPDVMDVAVIGAGPAGLACANILREAGLTPVIFEKSRGVGGRLATRRRDEAHFDHGAPKVEATSPEALEWLRAAERAGSAIHLSDDETAFVGLPGMSALCRPLAEDLDIRFSTEVTNAQLEGDVWHLETSDGPARAGLLAIAIPAPQVLRLLGDVEAVKTALQDVVIAPCWTLMVQFEDTFEPSPDVLSQGMPFAQIICDSKKPGRTTDDCWVVHATVRWSRAHLEYDKEEVCDLMLDALGPGTTLPPAKLAMAHRWRFAQTEKPLGRDHLALPDDRLFIGGDWTLGPRAKHGFLSGQAMGRAILTQVQHSL